MKSNRVLWLFVAVFFLGACSKKKDVQFMCYGNGQSYYYDFGVKNNPSLHSYSAQCDTMGA